MTPRRVAAGALSLVLFVSFFMLRYTPSRIGAPQYPDFASVLPPEFNFWLGHTLLAAPAAVLGAYALQDRLVQLLDVIGDAIDRASSRDAKLALAMAVGLFAIAAAVGRDVVLSNVSIVDDEEALRFGGQILASGHVFADDSAGLLRNTFELFLFWQGTKVASFDVIGIVGMQALAERTGLGSHLFAFFAAVPLAGVAFAARHEIGRKGAAVAVALLAFAPMFVALSFTCHTHVLSRAYIAVGYALFAYGLSRGGWKLGVALGLVLGLAVVTRPAEATCLLGPFFAHLCMRAARSREYRPLLGATLLAGLLPIAALLWHNAALTGSAFTFARNLKTHAVSIIFGLDPFEVRFASQIAHNGMVLAVFSFGLLGAALAAFGAVRNTFATLLAVGIGCVFAIGLLHQDYGVHIVGPMHQSECIVPLVLLVTIGMFRVSEVWPQVPRARVFAIGAFALVAASLAFDAIQIPELWVQTRAHHEISEYLAETTKATPEAKVVVIAPSYLRVMHSVPRYLRAGSWQNGWSRPRPDLSDDVVVLTVEPDPSPLTVPRESLPLSPAAAAAPPLAGIPIGRAEYGDREFLARAEAELGGRIRARFPDRRIYKLKMDPAWSLVRVY